MGQMKIEQTSQQPSLLQGREPAVRPMSDVLGSETPKLKVQGSANLERSVSAISSSAGCAKVSLLRRNLLPRALLLP